MELIEYSLDELVKHLKHKQVLVFVSTSDHFEGVKNVYTLKPDSDFRCIVGVDVSAIFVDSRCSGDYPLSTLLYLLTRIRGELSNEFPDKLYVTSKQFGEEVYTFYGELNIE